MIAEAIRKTDLDTKCQQFIDAVHARFIIMYRADEPNEAMRFPTTVGTWLSSRGHTSKAWKEQFKTELFDPLVVEGGVKPDWPRMERALSRLMTRSMD